MRHVAYGLWHEETQQALDVWDADNDSISQKDGTLNLQQFNDMWQTRAGNLSISVSLSLSLHLFLALTLSLSHLPLQFENNCKDRLKDAIACFGQIFGLHNVTFSLSIHIHDPDWSCSWQLVRVLNNVPHFVYGDTQKSKTRHSAICLMETFTKGSLKSR